MRRATVLVIWPERRMVTEARVIGWAQDAFDTQPDDFERPTTFAMARELLEERGLVTFGEAKR